MRSILTEQGHIELQKLLNSTTAQVKQSQDGERVECEVPGFRCWLQTSEEALILQEIFTEKDYEVNISGKFIAIDIGMNAGFTSLYLASHANCVGVFGFEPMIPTFDAAVENLKLNPHLQSKIAAYSYGLADGNREIEVDYCPMAKGMMNMYGIHPALKTRKDIRKEKIQVLDAAKEIKKVCDLFPELPIFLKIDCEGAEYEIIPHLEKHGILDRISQFALEWHYKGPDSLDAAFTRAGFQTTSNIKGKASGILKGQRFR